MLRRLYEPSVYDPAPPPSYWEEGVKRPRWPKLTGDRSVEVAVIGGGYTGLSTALHLAEAGRQVVVLDAAQPGWGASGRNGGFCCLGGSALPYAAQVRRFGAAAAAEHLAMQAGAVNRVADLVARLGLQVDCQPGGEICLAHRPAEMATLRAEAEVLSALPGVSARLLSRAEVRDEGMGMAGAHGALHLSLGFGLHPLKFAIGLARAAQAAGAELFSDSAVTRIVPDGAGGWALHMPGGVLSARQVVVATNGYSSEDTPGWMRGRYMPILSNIMVTRPLSGAELQAQGWTSRVMSYDSRTLLHYFRLLPDNRFLLGMRGNVRAGAAEVARHKARMRQHFDAMFPAWTGVETTHDWSGLVCMTRDRLSFIGPVPGAEGLFAGLGWHGNGVAMGTEAGARLAALVQGHPWEQTVPAPARGPLRRFPFAPFRRAVLPWVYGWYRLGDGSGP